MNRYTNENILKKTLFLIKDYTSYIVVKSIYSISKILPMCILSNFCGIIVAILGIPLKHSRIALSNFEKVFPEMPMFKRYKLLIECLFSLGKFGGELLYAYDMKEEKFKNIVSLQDKETEKILNEIKNNNFGSVIFSGHFANWEFALRHLCEYGIKLNVVYRELNNELIEKKVMLNMREKCGVTMISKGPTSIIKIFKALKKGENVLILSDQRYDGGIKSKLLGVDAYTSDSVPVIAKKFNCPIYSMVTIRENFSSKFKIKARNFKYSENESNEVIVQNMNNVIGDWIKENPNQWLFLHNRWKEE